MNLALSGLPEFACIPGAEVGAHHRSSISVIETKEHVEQAYRSARAGIPADPTAQANWLAIVRGYAGCRPQGDVFLIDSPCLPADWSRLRFRLQWHGTDFEVDLTQDQITIRNAEGAQPLSLNLCGKQVEIGAAADCSLTSVGHTH